jgi:hypothetical protein
MERPRRYQQLGSMLRELRSKRDLSQEEVVDAVAALESEKKHRYYDVRTLRRYESGEIRASRTALIFTVVEVFKETDIRIVNLILQVADYAVLTVEEISRYGLRHSVPEPQKTMWGPNYHMPPGIYIASSGTGEFIPWDKLKPEIETKLLNQLGGHIPAKCTTETGDWRDHPNWLTLIIDPNGKKVGEVWYGTDADQNWAFDGLVRVGDDVYVVWQVFQRYSDGSYRRIRKQAPRLQRVALDSRPESRTAESLKGISTGLSMTP